MDTLTLTSLPLNPLLQVADMKGELEDGFRMSINGPPSMTRSFSTTSSMCEPFSPPSAQSSPQAHVEVEPPYGSSMAFDFSPPSVYGTSYLDPDLKPQMERAAYLETFLHDGYPAMQRRAYPGELESYSFDSSQLLDPAISQPFAAHSGSFSSSYNGSLMDAEIGAATFDAPPSINAAVCIPEVCEVSLYASGDALGRLPLGNAPEQPRGSFGSSDSEVAPCQPFLFSNAKNMERPEGSGRKFSHEKRKKDCFAKRAEQIARKTAKPIQATENDSQGEEGPSVGFLEIKRISPGGFTCGIDGCGKSFNRKEHLKRHFNTYVTESPSLPFLCLLAANK